MFMLVKQDGPKYFIWCFHSMKVQSKETQGEVRFETRGVVRFNLFPLYSIGSAASSQLELNSVNLSSA